MVEYILQLDSIFGSLADPTRRDILKRVARSELSVNEIAGSYDISLAAVSKHLKILERAKLVMKRRQGKQHLIRATPETLADAEKYLEQYRQMWDERLDSLDQYLMENKE